MWFLEIENRANKKKELPTLWLKLLFFCRDYWTFLVLSKFCNTLIINRTLLVMM